MKKFQVGLLILGMIIFLLGMTAGTYTSQKYTVFRNVSADTCSTAVSVSSKFVMLAGGDISGTDDIACSTLTALQYVAAPYGDYDSVSVTDKISTPFISLDSLSISGVLPVKIDTFGTDVTADTIADTLISADMVGHLTWISLPDSATAVAVYTIEDTAFILVDKAENGGIYSVWLMENVVK